MNRCKKWLGNGIRLLTLILCVFTLLVSVSRAQVRPPGGNIGGIPPGGIGGVPPGGNIGGIPPGGNIGGFPPGPPGGNIGGIPPGGNIGGFPPGPPGGNIGGIPPGGNIGGMPPPVGGNIGGMPPIGGGNMMQRWTCKQCGAFLANAVNEPIHIATCPQCGVRFKNGPNVNLPNIPNNNFDPPPIINNRPPAMPDPGAVNPNPQNNEPRTSSTTRVIVWTLVGLGGFVAIVVVSGAIFFIVTLMNRSSKPRARR